MCPCHDPSWNFYPETILEFETESGQLRIDLRDTIPASVADHVARLGPGISFAIITSDNPYGRERPDSDNAQSRLRLAAELTRYGVHCRPVDGVSPDHAHRESGFAIWMDVSAARMLAQVYGQSAFFWFDGVRFYIEGALVNVPRQKLPIRS